MLRLSTFRKKMGYTHLNKEFKEKLVHLQRIGAILIQQSGFRAHSLCHPKIVVIKNEAEVFSVFNKEALLVAKERKREAKEQKLKRDIERRLRKLEYFFKWVMPLVEKVAKQLKIVNPAKFCRGNLDRGITNYLIEHEGAGTTEIAKAVGLEPEKGRHTIGKHLAKIARLSKNEGWTILEFHPEMKEGKFRAWWLDIEQVDIEAFHKSVNKSLH